MPIDALEIEVQAEYLGSIEAWRSGATYDVPGEIVIARDRKPR